MLPKLIPGIECSEQSAARRRLVNEELERMYPGVCVEDSAARQTFLELLAESDDGPEWALTYAFIALDDGRADPPDPRSPRLHPRTVEEQFAHVVVEDLELRNTTAREALDFLHAHGRWICEGMCGTLEYLFDGYSVVSLVPEAILEESRLTLTLRRVPLAAAYRHVLEAVGLHARLQESKLLVCSEGVAKALDMSTVYGHQDLLWELAGYLPPKDRTFTVRDREDLAEGWPNSLVVGTDDHTRLSAHYLLYGEPDTALDFGSLLFDWHEMSTPLGSFERYKTQEDWSGADSED